jgi:ABC-2 type transport system ATP-binding protein
MLLSLITPSTGSVELFGLPLRENRGTVLARVGGLVERADFYLYLSARRNLEIVADLNGGVSSSAIGEVLGTVGLAERAGDRVKSYSHGMKQRLGLAAALLGSPELVVLDEPTSGLDPHGIKEVRDLIARLAAERKVTVFLSSHLLSEIEHLATSMAIINNGSLVVQGNVSELLGAGTGTVHVIAVPAGRALEIIRSLPYVDGATLEQERIQVKIPAVHAGSMNAELVRAGIEVRALVPERSLEEYFLSITGEAPGL